MYGASVWQLDWLALDPDPDARDADGVQWFATKVEGFWGSPKPDMIFAPKVNQHGVFRTPGWKRQRIISVTGRAYAATDAVLRMAEARVSGLLGDDDTEAAFLCYSDIGPLECNVVLDANIITTPLQTVSEPGFEFSLQLAAPDPRKYGRDWQKMTTGLPYNVPGTGLSFTGLGGGIDFVTAGGLHFGAPAQAGSLDLRNVGTAPVSPRFTFNGPLTTPTLTTAAGTLTYNGTVAAGESVVIDTAIPSVLRGTTTVRHLLSPANFYAFAIPKADSHGKPGVLSVRLSHAGASTATGYVTADFRSAWF